MTKNLIIGGAGFIGAHLGRALANIGESVDILDNLSRGVRDEFLEELVTRPAVRLLNSDMLDASVAQRLDDDYSVIYQFAAIVGVRHVLERPYDVLRNNVILHDNAIALARRQKALRRFLFASTSEIYAGSLLHTALPVPTPEHVPLALTDLAHPRTSYMLSKIYGEAMTRHSGLPFTIVRPHNVYGPRMGLVHVVPELMQKALALPKHGRLEVASIDHRRTFCFVDDAVTLVMKLAAERAAAGGAFNVGNQEPELSIGDAARALVRAIGRSDLEVVTSPASPGSPVRRCPNMSRTLSLTGNHAPTTFDDGLRRTYEWYQTHVFSNTTVSAV